ncbi:MAG: phytanoyl-CoA dioxygenase family protein [Verrucomicrobia bacterium]|nr:phytanoyl-CoA dioxygenase family protein [Verrucomicrobiota bacterium]
MSPSASTEPKFDVVADLHAPELYQPMAVAQGVEHLSDIGPEQVAFYHEHGYLAVRQAFTPREVQDALAGLVDLIMGKRPDFTHIWFEGKAREILPTLGPEARQDAVRKIGDFVEFDARLKALSHHPALLPVLRTLLHGGTPQLFQDMALIKPPRLGREKPWHQDKAYFEYPLETPVVGVWIALDEATIENGCMQILPGRHKEGPLLHFQRRDWQICDHTILGTKSIAVPLKPGGLLLFDGMLPHGTPHNSSPNRRRALQYHYLPAGVKKIEAAERLKHFGADGKNVTC